MKKQGWPNSTKILRNGAKPIPVRHNSPHSPPHKNSKVGQGLEFFPTPFPLVLSLKLPSPEISIGIEIVPLTPSKTRSHVRALWIKAAQVKCAYVPALTFQADRRSRELRHSTTHRGRGGVLWLFPRANTTPYASGPTATHSETPAGLANLSQGPSEIVG